MTQLHDPATTVTMTIPVGRIVDGDNNRRDYPEDHIRSLAASILRDGQRDPLLVRPLDGGLFGLLSGHCRARAFHLLAEEHHAIDPRCVVVHPDSAEEADRIILDTNHHRQDPDEVETGEGYRRMIDRHGWTVERLGVEFGKSPRYVLNRLAVAKLGPLLRTAFLAKGFGLTVAQVIADAELTEAEQTGLWRLLQTCPAVTPEVTAELCDKFLAARDVQGGLFGGDWSEANTTEMFPDWTPPSEPALPGRDKPPEWPEADGSDLLTRQAEWWEGQAVRWVNHFGKPAAADRCRAAAEALRTAAERLGTDPGVATALAMFVKALSKRGVDRNLCLDVLKAL